MTETRGTREHLVLGLLGPSGAELTCEECFDLLDVYVDSELAGEHADVRVPEMREHLAGCPACAQEHDSLRDLLTTLQ
jgi:anti-sigma factor RsiW